MDVISEFLARTSVDLPVTLFRLLLSFILGGLIGLERGWHRQAAGLRTHMVICVGSTLLTLLSIYLPQTHTAFSGGDPGRIAAQIVSGIGFLGGGAIFRLGVNVRGLTTAASIWVVAGIGMAVGAGMYGGALIATAVVLFTLFVLVRFERRVFPARSLRNLEIVVNSEKIDTEKIFPILKSHGVTIRTLDVSQSFEEKTVRMRFAIFIPDQIDLKALYDKIGEVQGIAKITLDQKI
jgi:putative Mg2+ transporter-C (MgtC) family protein